MVLKALIFDVDGTLAETEEAHRTAFNAAFKEAGLDWFWDYALYANLLKTTGGKERIRHFVKQYRTSASGDDLDALIGMLHRRKTAIYTQLVSSGQIDLRPGIRELIEAARSDGIRLAIATTTSMPNVEALLLATLGAGGVEAFEIIGAGDDVPQKKPAPDIYLSVLAQLALPASACLALEDSNNGLRSALAAQIPVLITTSAYSCDEDFADARIVVAQLTDLIPMGLILKSGTPDAPKVDGGELLQAVRNLHADSYQRP
ncbi:MAG: HAD-IA family hydrolase [Hyphomicrobiaceae bacterium]